MDRYEVMEVDGERIFYNFIDRDIIDELLISPDNTLSLFKRIKETGEVVKDDIFQNIKHLPTLEAVIIGKGYNVHTFDDCYQIYGELFEKDDLYLPFDNDEIYITLEDSYQGCCTRGGWEFSTREYHYFFGIINKEID